MSVPGPRSRVPMIVSLAAVAVVWMLGCIWSFREQRDFAALQGFAFPALLPLVIDGLAAATGGVAWAASVDGRSAVPARMATVLAVMASAASNGVWAWTRSEHNPVTVVLAVAVPVAANLAFEVLLGELRRQVQQAQSGRPRVPLPRLSAMGVVLAPRDTLTRWRREVLATSVHEPSVVTAMSAEEDETGAPRERPPSVRDDVAGPPVEVHPEAVLITDSVDDQPTAETRPAQGLVLAREAGASPPLRHEPARDALEDSRGTADARVVALAQRLRSHPELADLTGAEACRLLGIEATPRTGRRLLSRAREYLAEAPELVGSSSSG